MEGENMKIIKRSGEEKVFDVKLKRMEMDGEWKYIIC